MRVKLFLAAVALVIAAGALLVTTALSQVALFASLELKGIDLLFALRGARPAPEQVVVVAVDEPSFAELRLQWPWPRSLHGHLVRKLATAGAQVIGMDILFAETSEPKEDAALAEALRDVGGVVLASERAVVNDGLFRHSMHVDPIPGLRDAAEVGVPMVLLDPDGTVRRTRLALPGMDSFALLVAKKFLALRGTDSARSAVLAHRARKNTYQEVLIDHLGPPRTVATASYYQALDFERLLPSNFFAGKVVLVGRSLAAIPEPQHSSGDTFLTPYTWLGSGPTAGVEIQATIVSNLLEGGFPMELGDSARLLFLFIFLAAASLLLARLKPIAGLLATAILAAVLLALAYVVFLQTGIVVPIVVGTTGLALVYGTHLLVRTIQAEHDRRRTLEEANRNLEIQVAERTHELTVAHEELQERHRDLHAAYHDLARTQEQLIQSEKMASLGLLVAGVAHELNNPVSYVYSNLDFVDEYVTRLAGIAESGCASDDADQEREGEHARTERLATTMGTLQELIRSCREGTERIKRIVLDLRTFSRTDDVGKMTTDLHAGLESTLNLLAKQYKDRIQVHRDFGDLPEVECYPGQINQVFMNLLQNAAQAIPAEGDVWITTRAQGDLVTISVRDNGNGIGQQDLGKLFDPFFTTKPVGSGTGLGLSISYGIVKKHGGSIYVRSQLGKGAEFVIELPVRAAGDQHQNETA